MDVLLKYKFGQDAIHIYCVFSCKDGKQSRFKGNAEYKRLAVYPDERVQRWFKRAQDMVKKNAEKDNPNVNVTLFTEKESSVILQKLNVVLSQFR